MRQKYEESRKRFKETFIDVLKDQHPDLIMFQSWDVEESNNLIIQYTVGGPDFLGTFIVTLYEGGNGYEVYFPSVGVKVNECIKDFKRTLKR